ncbi:MAG: hypothetical protein ACODAJ_03545 [Planctomycetota bacterium]
MPDLPGSLSIIWALGCCLSGAAGEAAKPQGPPPPEAFAYVFSVGYGTVDHFPQDERAFEQLLVHLKDSGYNTIHCVYRDWRLPLCRKHGVKMMIDVLAWKEGAETDIRRPAQQAAVQAICEKVRGDKGVWGYNLWNEKLAFFGRPEGKSINHYLGLLRQWDPTHPVWVGTYRNHYPQAVAGNPGVFGYYDYHWRRGMHWHFALLSWYQGLLNERDAFLGRWIYTHDYNRNLYTLTTSIAHGLKVCIGFLGGPLDKRGRWNPDHHFCRIGRKMHTLWPELMRIGRPLAVYSTPTSRTPDNRDKEPGIPQHLTPFPADHWLQVKQGEAVVGFFRHADGSDTVYVANHNAFAWQGMVLGLAKSDAPVKAWQFDREAGQWAPFEPGQRFSFPLAPGDGELFKFRRGTE